MTSSRRDFLRTAVLLSAAAPLAAAGCSTTDPEKEKAGGGTLQKAKDAGSITVGFANEAPYGYTDKSGKLTGEAPSWPASSSRTSASTRSRACRSTSAA